LRVGFRTEDIDAALETLEETFDIDRADIDPLVRQVELQALVRSHGNLLCGDIMSRDVVKIGLDGRTETARALLLTHSIRTLPVVDEGGRLVGTVGLRELVHAADRIGDLMSDGATASSGDLAFALLPILTDGRTHAVIVVDADRQILGLITQTDLLTALARSLPANEISPAVASA
jgi:CBS domain-containing membrane protein